MKRIGEDISDATFKFSLHQNDLVKLVTKKKTDSLVTLMGLTEQQAVLLLRNLI